MLLWILDKFLMNVNLSESREEARGGGYFINTKSLLIINCLRKDLELVQHKLILLPLLQVITIFFGSSVNGNCRLIIWHTLCVLSFNFLKYLSFKTFFKPILYRWCVLRGNVLSFKVSKKWMKISYLLFLVSL